MLVACQLVNLTTWTQARDAFEWLRGRYVVPEVLSVAGEKDLHDRLRPLGLWRRRANILIRFANAWVASPPSTAKQVSKMPGCGKYASDSWAIFMEGRSDVQVTDGKLLWHLECLKEQANGRLPASGRVQQQDPGA